MPINRSGGNKSKRRKNISGGSRKPEDISKISEEHEVYGRVVSAVGNRRFMVTCQQEDTKADYLDINCQLKGSYKKIIRAGDYVLVQLWEFDAAKGTIIDSYTPAEVARLDSKGYWDYTGGRASASASASAAAIKPQEINLFEFIDDTEAEERTIKKQDADDRLGPAGLLSSACAESDDFDISAI